MEKFRPVFSLNFPSLPKILRIAPTYTNGHIFDQNLVKEKKNPYKEQILKNEYGSKQFDSARLFTTETFNKRVGWNFCLFR